jgi:hypothetical protein
VLLKKHRYLMIMPRGKELLCGLLHAQPRRGREWLRRLDGGFVLERGEDHEVLTQGLVAQVIFLLLLMVVLVWIEDWVGIIEVLLVVLISQFLWFTDGARGGWVEGKWLASQAMDGEEEVLWWDNLIWRVDESRAALRCMF